MKKVYTLMRLCSGKAGSISVPQGTFSTKEAAEDAQKAKNIEFQVLMQAKVMQVTGPNECEPVMEVAQLLQLLGIENVQFFSYEADVHESALLALPAEKKIILAS